MQVLRDDNRITALEAVLNTDGTTPVALVANATSHELMVSQGSSGSDLGTDNAKRDENHVTGLVAASNADDGAIVPLYADSSGKLLISIL